MKRLIIAAVVSCTPAQVQSVETGGIGVAVCVLNHAQEPPEQIAKDCAGVTVEQVIAILDAHKAAEDREKAQAASVK